MLFFFANKQGRLSNDRLQRVRGMTNKKKTNKETSAEPRKTSSKKDTDSDSVSDSSDRSIVHETDEDEEENREHSESDSESDSNLSVHQPIKSIQKDLYYAVFYDKQWYLGRILDKDEEKSTNSS